MNLDFDLEIVNGIGKKTKSELNENGIYSILDLLYLFPKNYEIFEENPKLLRSEEYTVIKGDLDSNPVFLKHRTNSNAIIFYLNCFLISISIPCKWNNLSCSIIMCYNFFFAKQEWCYLNHIPTVFI